MNHAALYAAFNSAHTQAILATTKEKAAQEHERMASLLASLKQLHEERLALMPSKRAA